MQTFMPHSIMRTCIRTRRSRRGTGPGVNVARRRRRSTSIEASVMQRLCRPSVTGLCYAAMGSDERARLLREAVRAIASRCPRLIAECYWAGTSAIALEELGHRESFDLDFH